MILFDLSNRWFIDGWNITKFWTDAFTKCPLVWATILRFPTTLFFLHWVPKRWNKDHNQTSVKKNSRGFKRVGERRGGSHQWGSVARRLGQMPSILLQGDNNQLPLLQGDTAHTNFFYFSFKGTHTNYLYYSFKGTHRAHTLTFSTSMQWGTHQTSSTSTILPILILLLLLFLSL